MDLIEPPARAAANDGFSVPRASYRFFSIGYFMSRPILMGVLVLLASVVCLQVSGQTVGTSYEAPRYSHLAAISTHSGPGHLGRQNSSNTNAVPLLFLSFVGLAGMALSRTGPSKELP